MATAGGAAACGGGGGVRWRGGGVRCCGGGAREVWRRRAVRRPACRGGGDGVRNSGSTSPPLSLRARCGGEGEGPRLNRGKCHRSRALGTPGTFDSSFPGGIMARDLCAAINAAVSPFAA